MREPSSYPGDPTAPEIKRKFRQKKPSQYFDPCAEAADLSMKCLDAHGYDKSQCADFFQSYRDCKKKWLAERREDRRKGLKV